MNDECIADLTSVLFGPKRDSLEKSLARRTPQLPTIKTLDWRLDMIISERWIVCVNMKENVIKKFFCCFSEMKVFEPCLLFEIQLSDGKVHRFHVSLSQFHKLRHRVASMLSEMASLEKRSFLKQWKLVLGGYSGLIIKSRIDFSHAINIYNILRDEISVLNYMCTCQKDK